MQSGTTADKTRAALNVLLEAPYFYKSDDEDLFLFIMRYQRALTTFFETTFGWQFVVDAKCARLFKPRWYNEKITPANRDCFNLSRRDECIAFMLLLEFFESKLEAESLTIDDPENLRFRFGELLAFQHRRFRETFPDHPDAYGDEQVRQILRRVMPTLERYRFLLKIKPPHDERVAHDDLIYECLPALWHYNVTAVVRPPDSDSTIDPESAPNVEDDDHE